MPDLDEQLPTDTLHFKATLLVTDKFLHSFST